MQFFSNKSNSLWSIYLGHMIIVMIFNFIFCHLLWTDMFGFKWNGDLNNSYLSLRRSMVWVDKRWNSSNSTLTLFIVFFGRQTLKHQQLKLDLIYRGFWKTNVETSAAQTWLDLSWCLEDKRWNISSSTFTWFIVVFGRQTLKHQQLNLHLIYRVFW